MGFWLRFKLGKKQIGPEIRPSPKCKSRKILFRDLFVFRFSFWDQFWGLFFCDLFCLPLLCRRPETYFLARRLDCNSCESHTWTCQTKTEPLSNISEIQEDLHPPLPSLPAQPPLHSLWLYRRKPTVRDNPNTTTTTFKFYGAPFLLFGVPQDAAPNAPSTQWNTEITQIFFIWYVIKCRFDTTSNAKLFWKIMVVAGFGPSLKQETSRFLQCWAGCCRNLHLFQMFLAECQVHPLCWNASFSVPYATASGPVSQSGQWSDARM